MSYKVAVRPDGQSEVPIHVDTKNFKIEKGYDGGIDVELEYAKYRLLQGDPAGADAILGAWPTVDELVLYRKEEDEDQGEWAEIFAGVITKVDTDDHELVIAAHMDDTTPPTPLTVTVQEDTDDPARLTVLVTADNDGEGQVFLEFGDGSGAINVGDGTSGNQHAYTTPGSYVIKATSGSDAERVAEQSVTVPYTG